MELNEKTGQPLEDCGCEDTAEKSEPIEVVTVRNLYRYRDVPGKSFSEHVYRYITLLSYMLLAAWAIYFIVKFAELSNGRKLDG